MRHRLPFAPRAVVTGAGSGLGRSLALLLAARQGRILVTDVDEGRAAKAAAEVEAAGGEAEAMLCDVGRLEDLNRAAARMDERWGGTDLLVNNAGVAAAGLVGEMPIEDWEWLLRIDLWGAIHGCHAFVPGMKRRGAGAVLNVASSAGIVGLPRMAAYNVAKAGVISLSETLAAELGPHGVQVSVLCPTFFRTNLMDTFRSVSARERELAEALFKRASSTVDQVAQAALRGLEQGELVVVPQRDGAWLWRMKRYAPGLFQLALRKIYGAGLHERALLSRRRESAHHQPAAHDAARV